MRKKIKFLLRKNHYTFGMKKICFISLVLLSFLVFLLMPLLLLFHNQNMNMWQESNCIAHCIQSDTYFQEWSSSQSFFFQEFLILKVFWHIFQTEIICISLIFFFLLFHPPTLFRKIKNADYANLIGIIQSNT